MANGSFAVRASDMYRFPRKVDILQKQTDPFQARLDHDHETSSLQ